EFKLRADAREQALAILRQREADGEDIWTDDKITFQTISGDRTQKLNGSAFNFRVNNSTVTVANMADSQDNARAFLGMVRISLEQDGAAAEEVEQRVAEILSELGVADGLSEVDAASEALYKKNSYLWHHKIDSADAAQEAAALNLQRQEVFPEYFALVDEGKQAEYQERFGELLPVHELYTADYGDIANILQNGLLSSSERYRRGLLRSGMSTSTDFGTGGADSVFVRTRKKGEFKPTEKATIAFKPEIYERTDWYAYGNDEYGRTDALTFGKRLSPEELFGSTYLSSTNEQMFRMGIGPNAIDAVYMPTETDRAALVQELQQRGITEIGGKKIEDVIQDRMQLLDEVEKADAIAQAEQYKIEAAEKAEKKQAVLDEVVSGDFEELSIEEIQQTLDDDSADSLLVVLEKAVSDGHKTIIGQKLYEMILLGASSSELEELMGGSGYEDGLKIINYARSIGVDLDKVLAEIKEKEKREQEEGENDGEA
ncbi:hypothetical protein FWG76_01610, partial [Candidatus Saccharibacteria bacterium]|nr:hypothetical protein [Candidatus Saccharibacteria bacterium]